MPTVQCTAHLHLSLVELGSSRHPGLAMSVPSWSPRGDELETLKLVSTRNCLRRIVPEVTAKKNVVK